MLRSAAILLTLGLAVWLSRMTINGLCTGSVIIPRQAYFGPVSRVGEPHYFWAAIATDSALCIFLCYKMITQIVEMVRRVERKSKDGRADNGF